MNLARNYYLTAIIFKAHISNWFWRDRATRKKIRNDVAAKYITKYLKRYLYAVKNLPDSKPNKNNTSEKIWTIWLQGENNAPDLVRACYNSVRKNCKQELIVLDENTLFDYIKLPDVIMKKRKRGQIKNAHFADICRVELLYNYGGFWLDSTGFASHEIQDWIESQDFFMYLVGDKIGDKYSFVQNCFIRSKRGSYLLNAWRAMIHAYWSKEPNAFDYFMHQVLFRVMVENDDKCKLHFEKMKHVYQEPTHSVWWTVRQKQFNQKKFDELTKDSFFQKLTYLRGEKIIPNSFADVMINKMYKGKK